MDLGNLPKGLAMSGALEIRERLKLVSGGRILDVATGNGEFIDTLMKTLKDYDSFVGIDNSVEEIAAARKRFEGERVEILEMNAEVLDFEMNYFDTVTLSFSLRHLYRMNQVLVEMKRVLKSGGHFIIQEPFRDGEQDQAQRVKVIQQSWQQEVDSLLNITYNKIFTKQRIMNVVEGLGLKQVEVFESSHMVHCLFCEEKFSCADPKNKKTVAQEIRGIDKTIDRLRKHPQLSIRDRLQREGERLKESVKEFGYAETSHVFILGTK